MSFSSQIVTLITVETPRRLRRTKTALFLLGATVAATSAYAQNTPAIDQIIANNGGCAFVSARWQQELRRQDGMPFNKPAASWTGEDLGRLRAWIERCLDPFTAAPGRREMAMQNADASLRRFADQGRAPLRPDPRDTQSRYAEAENRTRALYEKALAEKVLAYEQAQAKFNAVAIPYLEKTKVVDVDQLTGLAAQAPEVKQVLEEAGIATGQLMQQRALSERGGVKLEPFTSPQSQETVKFRLEKIEQLNTRFKNCVPALVATGMPENLAKSRVLMLKGPSDPYLFEILCPPPNRAEFARPGMLSKYPSLSFNGGAARLWFEVRESNSASPSAKPDVRIIVRRISTPRGNFEAATDLEAANLVEPLMAYVMLL